jgi:hypothetical protein
LRADETCSSPYLARIDGQEEFVYVWTLGVEGMGDGSDKLVTVVRPDGSLTDSGEILEIDPPRRMVIRWQNEWNPELKAEGPSRCSIELEPVDRAVKLTITHEIDGLGSKLIPAVSGGWPRILSNLKSLLETGEVAITSHPGH